ncbi:FemAB family PEP-CTERM system-associated protein [Pacificimonas sp. WHA3]|uniref:FemAB family PEP-CTERM system-associated protein n=2 Tax=Pacificimonas pallii TaxID=2827236 RepID=A0ABS6SFJ0_9SPHN|nr:FemAB family PEP-CTERM system-associated protein [Pacificimonas pallii]
MQAVRAEEGTNNPAGAVDVVTDDAAYDAYLAKAGGVKPFHRRAWGDAIAASCGHRVHHLVATRAGEPVGVLPLTEIRSALFGKSLVSNGFAVEGGPLYDDDAALAALDGKAWDIARSGGIDVLEYRGPGRVHADWAKKDDVYASFVRPIAADTDANLTAIPRKQRAEVRKSLKLNLEVAIGRDAAALDEHYGIYATSVRNLGTPVFPRSLFREMVTRFGENADVLTVRKDGAPVASVLSFYDNGTVYPYWGGGTFAARGLKANEHMYWMLMEHAHARGCTAFDFGRSKVGTGPYSYKKNWGFEPQPLVYEYRLGEGAEMPNLNPNSPKFKLMTDMWQRLPLWLANRLGPMIAKDLG